MKTKLLLPLLILLFSSSAFAQTVEVDTLSNRWTIQDDGSIIWKVGEHLPHEDHIEMAGEKVALWVKYGIDQAGASSLYRTLVFPTFRKLPVNTKSHITYSFSDSDLPYFFIDGRQLQLDLPKRIGSSMNEPYKIQTIEHKGIMTVNAVGCRNDKVQIERKIFPSVNRPLVIEKFKFTNSSDKMIRISMDKVTKEIITEKKHSTPTSHHVIMSTIGDGFQKLEPGESAEFAVYFLASDAPQSESPIDPAKEEAQRAERVAGIVNKLQLVTPDKTLNTAFDFAKIRATESIYKTKGGYMHGPGGLAYYAAIWANDQAEYVNPFFAFSGDSIGHLSAMNCYAHFARFMNDEYNYLPSSIIAEGVSVWKGAKDRGDAAMIAYGAARYALANGSMDDATELWPLIEWCLEYNHRQLNDAGVVQSNSDELEGRFPAGDANLSTSSLYYDALRSSVLLAKALGKPQSVAKLYQKRADALENNIEAYFGAEVEGFDTYRYYEGNDVLRSWICLPLTVGIYTRKEGTIAALFSPRLWTDDGLLTEAGDKTFWDRSTLYALRGVLEAGDTEKAIDFLKYYSNRRLLGEHVPYAIEAFPEGNQRHLSAESGLYCRIFTEGLFGMRPTGFNTFNCTPRLPKDWDRMALKNIHAFGQAFDLEIEREKGKLRIVVYSGGKKLVEKRISEGSTVEIKL